MSAQSTETVRIRISIPMAALLLVATLGAGGVLLRSRGGSADERAAEAGPGAGGASPAMLVEAVDGTTTVAAPPEASFDADECIHGPGSVPAGLTKITLTNMGKEIHQIQLVELEEGRTYDDVTRALQSPDEINPSWITYAGGPNAVVPGRSASAFVDLKPGNYVVICTIANSLGKPHYTVGMAMELNVTEASTKVVAAPAADLEVTGMEYNFGPLGATGALPAGPRVVSFANKGTQPHEAALIRLNEGASAADYFDAVAHPGEKPLPGTRVGGLGAIEPGQEQSFTTDLAPGRYALICFVIDPDARLAHAALGMTTEFEVN